MDYSSLQDVMLYEKSRVAFGCFDGIHLGHKAVLDRLPGYEAQVPVVLSFEKEEEPVLCSPEEKRYLLRDSGIGLMVSSPRETAAAMDAETFAREILSRKLHAASVVTGEDLRFGCDRKGVRELIGYGEKYGFSVSVVPSVRVDGETVSADAVRRAVREGDYPQMKRLLGHPYVMIGRIIHGKGEGHQHDMPTANLAYGGNKLLPPYGVYATLSRFDGTLYGGLTNIGPRPSVDEDPVPTVETWMLQLSGSIYGREVVLELHEYIRGIIKFPDGLEAVRKQIDKDLAAVHDSLERLINDTKQQG